MLRQTRSDPEKTAVKVSASSGPNPKVVAARKRFLAKTSRKPSAMVLVLFLVAILWIFSASPHRDQLIPAVDNGNTSWQEKEDFKSILYYTPYWQTTDFQFGEGHEPFRSCPVNKCFATSNRTHFSSPSKFDAVLFHAYEFQWSQSRFESIQAWRSPHQRFVFVMMESPQEDRNNYDRFSEFFNWTMTYRLDSDLPRPYGWFLLQGEPYFSSRRTSQQDPFPWMEYREPSAEQNQARKALASRPKKVAWIASHCPTSSMREQYVQQLSKYIQVDTFGACGKTPCNDRYRPDFRDNCTEAVDRDYKFYLGFENALCNGYITEKFFKRVNWSLVIALGQGDYSKVAPPHSYLNAMDYESPQALAHYLHELDRNDSLYLSYFWWKSYYDLHHLGGGGRNSHEAALNRRHARTMCQLCEMLHSQDQPPKIYKNMGGWWRRSADCGRRFNLLMERMGMNVSSTSRMRTMSGGEFERLSSKHKASSQNFAGFPEIGAGKRAEVRLPWNDG